MTNPDADRDIGVHESRKNCKRIRAMYRLIRDEIGVDFFQRENIRFRDSARMLAGARDSLVMIQTLDRLIDDQKDHISPDSLGFFRQKLLEQYRHKLTHERENQIIIPHIQTMMQAAIDQIVQISFKNEDFSVFRGGIQRVYRRGQKTFRFAYTEPSVEVFREWRKNVKYLWYELELLEAISPNVLSKLRDELHTLSDYLGYDHDLAVLRSKVLESSKVFGCKKE